jgi:hypothetical protein
MTQVFSYLWVQFVELIAWLNSYSVRRQWRFVKIVEAIAKEYRQPAVRYDDPSNPTITISRVALSSWETLEWVRVMNGDQWFHIRLGRYEISIQDYHGHLYERCLAAWNAITQ